MRKTGGDLSLLRLSLPALFLRYSVKVDRNSLFEDFVRYLAVRIAEQQVIANMVTVDTEQWLGKALLQLTRALGKKEPLGLRIETKIAHE